jgi:hypothetical protein
VAKGQQSNTTDWTAVGARAQAYQAMHLAGLSQKRLPEKARFLMVLGLSRAEAAALLGSSDDSLRITLAREAKKEATAGSVRAEPDPS